MFRSVFFIFIFLIFGPVFFSAIAVQQDIDSFVASNRIDINCATRQELLKLNAIDPDIIEIICLYRELKGPIRSFEHLFKLINANEDEQYYFHQRVYEPRPDAKTSIPAVKKLDLPSIFSAAPPTIPPKPKGTNAFRVCIISDSNGRYGSIKQGCGVTKAVKSICNNLNPDFVIHNGDMIAGQKRNQSKRTVMNMWSGYENEVVNPLTASGIPIFPVGGNHDSAPGFQDRGIFEKIWNNIYEDTIFPEQKLKKFQWVDKNNFPFYYAFKNQGCFFVIMGSSTGSTKKTDLSALKRIMKNVLLKRAPEEPLFVFNHVPFEKLYKKEHGNLRPEKELYSLFMKSDVTLFFTAHYEVYFKGYYKSLPVISTGLLASAQRKLLKSNEKYQGMSFIVMDIYNNTVTDLFAVTGNNFDKVFNEKRLSNTFGNYKKWDFYTPVLK